MQWPFNQIKWLLSDNIKWVAGRLNRSQFGEKLAVDARVNQIPIMLLGDSIDGDGV